MMLEIDEKKIGGMLEEMSGELSTDAERDVRRLGELSIDDGGDRRESSPDAGELSGVVTRCWR